MLPMQEIQPKKEEISGITWCLQEGMPNVHWLGEEERECENEEIKEKLSRNETIDYSRLDPLVPHQRGQLYNDIKNLTTRAWIQYVMERIQTNQNFFGVFLGPVGSGKSYAALRLAEILDPNFTIDNVCFTVEEFHYHITQANHPKGTVIILDEAGTAASAREFYTEANKVFGMLLETSRFKNYIYLMTLPDITFLDKKGRILAHGEFHCNSRYIEYEKRMARVKGYTRQPQPSGKIWRPYIKLFHPIHGRCKGMFLHLHKPTTKLVNRYGKKREERMSRLWNAPTFDDTGSVVVQRPLTERQLTVYKAVLSHPTWKNREVEMHLGLSEGAVAAALGAIKKKGFHVVGAKADEHLARATAMYETKAKL